MDMFIRKEVFNMFEKGSPGILHTCINICIRYTNIVEVKGIEDAVLQTSEKYLQISKSLDELSRRLRAANESIFLGYGGNRALVFI